MYLSAMWSAELRDAAGFASAALIRLKKGIVMQRVWWGLIICASALAQDFYVAVDGCDDNAGTKLQPFATVDRARAAVREYKDYQGWPDGGVTVWIREGQYPVEQSIEFTYRDSGLPGAPVVYRAFPGETVRLQGGVAIAPEHFVPVTDPAILSRIVEEEARSHVLQLDLNALGITDLGQMSARGFRRPYVNPGLELFFNAEAMTIARWPNDSTVPIGRVLDSGSVPRQGDLENRGGVFMFDYDRAKHWSQADDIYVSGIFNKPWADDTIKVEKIDTAERTITLAYAHMYGIGRGAE